MFEVKKVTFGDDSMFLKKPGVAWVIVNRKTGEKVAEYQQLGVANMAAALMNKMGV